MSLRILIVALLASSAMATTYNTCDSKPAPINIQVVGCDAQPCTVKRGESVVVLVDFEAANSIRGIEAKVRATVLGITVDYPLPEPDACQSLVDSACPFEAGDLGTYKLDLPISEAVPQVPANVELSLVDTDTDDVISCFNIDLNVV